MRRTHLRGHGNILKRLLIHSGAFNLGLLLRRLTGTGTPRGLQGRLRALLALIQSLLHELRPAPALLSPRVGRGEPLAATDRRPPGGPYVH